MFPGRQQVCDPVNRPKVVAQPEAVRNKLKTLRGMINAEAPDAEEKTN